MNRFHIIESLELVSWPTVSVGWQRGWLTRREIEVVAERELRKSMERASPAIAELTMSNSLSNDDINKHLNNLAGSFDEAFELQKWKLAALIAVHKNASPENEKLDMLEEIYAEFDYPADMSTLSRYYQGAENPLDTIDTVINKLKRDTKIV